MRSIFLLIAFLICNVSFAQNWDLGVKGGINLASVSIKNSTSESKSVIGLHLGGYANTRLTDQITLQPEVLFSLQGWNASENRTISYLLIPVVAKYFLVDQFNVHAGPQIGFLLTAEDGIEDVITSTDFGAVFGAEYQINELFAAGVRYNLGLVNILDNPESSVELRSRVLQISCTYKLSGR